MKKTILVICLVAFLSMFACIVVWDIRDHVERESQAEKAEVVNIQETLNQLADFVERTDVAIRRLGEQCTKTEAVAKEALERPWFHFIAETNSYECESCDGEGRWLLPSGTNYGTNVLLEIQ